MQRMRYILEHGNPGNLRLPAKYIGLMELGQSWYLVFQKVPGQPHFYILVQHGHYQGNGLAIPRKVQIRGTPGMQLSPNKVL